MENNVIISIRGKQSFEDQEPEIIELVTEGRLSLDGEDGYTLSYQESELTGLEGTLRRDGGTCPCTTRPTVRWR